MNTLFINSDYLFSSICVYHTPYHYLQTPVKCFLFLLKPLICPILLRFFSIEISSIFSCIIYFISKKHSFLADITAFGGDSGGPAFIASLTDHPTIIGIVVAQFRHDEKIKMEYEERSIHYPLGLAEVVHAKYIRETIELAALSANPPLVTPDKDLQSKSAELPLAP